MQPAIESERGLAPNARIQSVQTSLNSVEPETFSAGESLLLKLVARLEEMRVTVEALRGEVAALREERDNFVFEREIHGGSRPSFRQLPDGNEAEIDGEIFRLHAIAQLEMGQLLLARTRRNGRPGYLLLVRRSRLVRSESLGPLEERIMTILVQRREQGIAAGLNAREIEVILDEACNVIPELPSSPVDSSIRSSICRLRGKLARLGGPKAQLIASEGGYRLRTLPTPPSE